MSKGKQSKARPVGHTLPPQGQCHLPLTHGPGIVGKETFNIQYCYCFLLQVESSRELASKNLLGDCTCETTSEVNGQPG